MMWKLLLIYAFSITGAIGITHLWMLWDLRKTKTNCKESKGEKKRIEND